MTTLDEIAELHTEAARAHTAARDADARRDQAIRRGVDAGLRVGEIARRLELTPGRISQILARAREAA